MFALLRSRLFRQQFIPLFMIMASLLVMVSAIIFLRTKDGIVARELQIATSYRDAVLGSLDRWLDDRVAETERLAREIETAAADGQDLESFWKRFAAMTGPGSSYTDFFLADPSGFVVVSKARTITRNINLSDRDYVAAGLAGRSFVSGLFQGRLSGVYVFAISQPVHLDSGHWVLAGVVSLENLAAIVDTLDLSEIGRAILVDQSGNIVSSPAYIESYAMIDSERRAYTLTGGATEPVLSNRPGAMLYADHQGETVVGAWGYVPRLGLALLVELDNRRAMAPLGDLLRFVGLLSVAALFAILFTVYSLSARLVQPITTLVAAVGEVKDDEFRARINMKTGTELDDLILAFNEMASTVRDREAGLKENASRDSLTGLYNHGRIEEFLELEMRRKRRSGELLCFVMADVDHFKKVNDTYGHQAGDDALRGITSLLNKALREGDILGRYGGEEFAVILNANREAEAAAFCERIRSAVEATEFDCDGHTLRLTISLGFVCTTTEGFVPFDIVRRADRALYEAKNAGRNAVRQA
ncbi:MAG: diguanylate cyclase [Clostridia bacterium]